VTTKATVYPLKGKRMLLMFSLPKSMKFFALTLSVEQIDVSSRRICNQLRSN
jgi:hypothetical protein